MKENLEKNKVILDSKNKVKKQVKVKKLSEALRKNLLRRKNIS